MTKYRIFSTKIEQEIKLTIRSLTVSKTAFVLNIFLTKRQT